MILGGLETGGTKMVCAVGNENGEIIEKEIIPTTTPDETLKKIIGYFQDKNIQALGVACFGPLDLDTSSDTYGYIKATPKPGWKDYNIVGTLKEGLSVPVGLDTDVNGALLGEVTYGSAQGYEDAIYLTIGTGIGGGVMSGGKLIHGMVHPELGHMLLAKREDDNYVGKCPYHGTCFEGLASGPAIEERWGIKGEQLSDHNEVWELESYYIAQAIVTCIMVLSPRIIILGGGVMEQKQLFPLIRNKVKEMLHGYIQSKELDDIEHYIVPSSLNGEQGIKGALVLAKEALKSDGKDDL